MKLSEYVQGSPIPVQRSMRGSNYRNLTSGKAGVVIPLAFHPLLREDRIRNGRISVSVRMSETVQPILNSVIVRVYAHLIPFSAFERFDGMDEFNRSYSGIGKGNDEPVPFFTPIEYDRTDPFWQSLGFHAPNGSDVNSAPVEAYNLLVNHRRRARSKHLPERDLDNTTTLARGFWSHPLMHDIVSDYELALMDGEVPLDANLGDIPERVYLDGLAISNRQSGSLPNMTGQTRQFRNTQGDNAARIENAAVTVGDQYAHIRTTGTGAAQRPDVFVSLPDIFEELRQGGISLSLSNIELAKQTVAFARLRQQYQGITEDHLIDLLMDAVRVPPESLNQPQLLGSGSANVSMTERYATDGDSLDKSRTTGMATVSFGVRTPAINTGGIVLITAEISPEPLYERLGDKFMDTLDPTTLPQFLRDYLDPKKVELVENKYVDVLHDTPDGLFGYRGLNRHWDQDFTRAGGKFFRTLDDAFVEDRQRFWVVETKNPTLTDDFYLVSRDLKYTPFADQNSDPFEILSVSALQIEGNTVFGKALHEDTGDYGAIIDRTRNLEENGEAERLGAELDDQFDVVDDDEVADDDYVDETEDEE